MAEVTATLCTEAHIARLSRNADNTKITDAQRESIRTVLGLLTKTWEEECVLPSAPCAPPVSTPTPSLNSSGSSPVPPASGPNPATTLVRGLEEFYYCAATVPTKGKLQQLPNLEAKPSSLLHLAAKVSVHHKDYCSPRCLVRTLYSTKWDVTKTYESLLRTMLWRHQHLPRYWTDEEVRSCVRMRYMDWYGVTKPISSGSANEAAAALSEARYVILHLRAHYNDITLTPEDRCRYVLIALEKGVSYMRSMYHGSQRRIVEAYAAQRPDEPFILHDAELVAAAKKAAKSPAPTPAGSPTKALPPKIPDAALRILEECVRGEITESQAKAAAAALAAASAASPAASSSPPPAPIAPHECIGEEELIGGTDQMVMLMDETNASSDNMDTKFLRFMAPILNSHYAERLAQCCVVNPTFMTSLCVSIIKLFVDDRTKSKLHLFDVPPMAMDEFLAENKLSWPGRTALNPKLVAAGEATAAERLAEAGLNLTPKEQQKREKERRKAREKRAKDLKYEDVVYPCDEVIALLGIENTPIKYGGRMLPISPNQYESWFHSVPPFSDPSQRDAERTREAARVISLKK